MSSIIDFNIKYIQIISNNNMNIGNNFKLTNIKKY